jgi:hypothetical protein
VITPRSLLIALLYAFFTLLTAFAVVMGGYLLATAVQDAPLAQVLRIVGIVCLLLLAIDALLLLLALSVNAVAGVERVDSEVRRRTETTAEQSQTNLP